MTTSSFPAAAALSPGYRLDRYELLCPLAQGGMASVWLARLQGKHGFEKLVAVKTILPSFAADSRFRQMFLDEARLASRIEHTNVAQILDLGEQHDLLYIVMEWVEGDSLSKLSRAIEKEGHRIPLGILLRILADACNGLHAAHELCDAGGHPLGVVHRDVSPQNILVNAKGIVKIIDFGVAKARDRHAEETSSGILKGKIQYMAPEQAMGKPLDRRADVWAVGAILHRMLSGKAPYEAENQLATLHLLSSGKPPPELPPSVPKPVAVIVRRALTHDANGRFATAAELSNAMEEAMRTTRNMTQASDVAAYMAEHLSQRSLARKEAVTLALKSSTERSRVAKVLETSTEIASGVTGTMSANGADPKESLPTAQPGGTQSRSQLSTLDPEASVGTLASASLESAHGLRSAPRISKLGVTVTVAAAVAAAALILRPRPPSSTETKQATEPATAAAPAAVPIPPPDHVREIVRDEPAPPPVLSSSAAPPTPPRRSPRPIVSRPKTEAPATAPKKRRVDDGF